MTRRSKILVCGEFSGISSGYGTIMRELMPRWHQMGFEVAELAAAVGPQDPRLARMPWRVYPTEPDPNNKQAVEVFNSNRVLNSMGKYIFEHVILNFKPDVVATFTDPWFHMPFIVDSPLRKFYKIAYQSPVDGFPQSREWIDLANKADGILTYTNWGEQVLRSQIDREVKAAHLCANHDVFKPLSKESIRQKFNIDLNANIIGMCARNQPRKDFDGLFRIFRKFLNNAPDHVAKNTFLYCHTSFPEATWNFSEMLHEHGLSSKVLFTYRCRNCKSCYPSFFVDSRYYCKKCGAYILLQTRPGEGIEATELNEIYNLFDVYIHIAHLAGFELPVLEAACTGLPVLCSDYTGTSDFVDTIGAIPLNVLGVQREAKSGRYWGAQVDDDECVSELIKILEKPRSMRAIDGERVRQKAISYYNWDKSAEIWAEYFRGVSLAPERWQEPPDIRPIPPIPHDLEKLPTSQQVEWCVTNIIGRPELVNDLTFNRFAYSIINQGYFEDMDYKAFTTKDLINICVNYRNSINAWERMRTNA